MQAKNDKSSFKTTFFQKKFSDEGFVKLAEKFHGKELFEFIVTHREKLKTMSSVEQIQNLFMLIISTHYRLAVENGLNSWDYERNPKTKEFVKDVMSMFAEQFKTIFKLEDLINLSSRMSSYCPECFVDALDMVITTSEQLAAILDTKGLGKDFKLQFAIKMKHVISDSDQLVFVLDKLNCKVEDLFHEVEDYWAKTWAWKCYFEFMTAATDEQASSHFLFTHNVDVATKIGLLIYEVMDLEANSIWSEETDEESSNSLSL
ncbi:hypothetical protein BN59_03631 [Legionella massiliensis]|uniref:Uncharacterized protein n=2 Tax=Legionella massiliensis TaxID=1034943 RepID=A0A078L5U1_9GAMM|nr:hypothetical protein BN59_03631 [Legionella massiliensis]CEE15051.1 hypothetical protein BN1094_03631 [Legionella massiliensis]